MKVYYTHTCFSHSYGHNVGAGVINFIHLDVNFSVLIVMSKAW